MLETNTILGGQPKHGHSSRVNGRSQTYKAWSYMKTRCLNPRREDYYLYGGRGITIHPPWIQSFEMFLRDMGECPAGMTLERKNPDGNYEPENCKWATRDEQANNKRTTAWVTYKGRTQSISQWAKEAGIHPSVLRCRILSWGLLDRTFTVSGKTERVCLGCGLPFEAMLAKHQFCTRKCRVSSGKKVLGQ